MHGHADLLDIVIASLRGDGDSQLPLSLQHVLLGMEGLLVRSTHFMMHRGHICPNCTYLLEGANPNEWSAPDNSPIDIAPAEAEFVDKVLYVLAASSMAAELSLAWGSPQCRLQELLDAGSAPFPNWLELLRRRTSSPTLKDLEARTGGRVSAETIHRINRGDMPKQRLVNLLTSLLATADSREARALRVLARDARALELAVGFLQAAHRGPQLLNAAAAFNAVSRRLGRLMLGLSQISKFGWPVPKVAQYRPCGEQD